MRSLDRKLTISEHLARRLYPAALVIGFLIGTGGPATYYALESAALRRTAMIYAQDLVGRFQSAIAERPALWKYQTYKYSKVIHDFVPVKTVASVRILDEGGRPLVSETGAKTGWGGSLDAAVGSAALVFNNRTIGTVEVTMAAGPLFTTTLLLLLGSTIAGLSLALVVYRLPVRVVTKLEAHGQQLQAAVLASERRFQDLVQGLDAIVWEADVQWPGPAGPALPTCHFTFVSQRAETILGHPVDRWRTDPAFWASVIHPDDGDATVGHRRAAIVDGRDHEIEYRTVAADGRVVWLRDIAHVVTGDEGRATHLRGVMIDVTEPKRAEEALRESEERFRGAFDGTAVGMALQAVDGRYLGANRAFCAMVGYSETELLATTFISIVDPRDVDGDVEADRQMLTGAMSSYQREKRYVHKLGRVVWAQVSVSLVRARDGHPLHFVAQVRDITAHKQAEARRMVQQAVTRILAESATLDEAIPTLLGSIGDGFGWDLGEAWLVDRDANLLRRHGSWRAPALDTADFAADRHDTTLARGAGVPGRVWATGHPIWIPDADTAADFTRASVAVAAGRRAAFAFPIGSGTAAAGVLVFFSRAVREPDDDLIRKAADLGDQIVQYVERRRAEARLRDSEAEARGRASALQRLTELNHLVTSSPGLQQIFDVVAEAVLDPLRADLARLWVVDETAGLLRLVASGGAAGDATSMSREFPVGRGIVGWVVGQKATRRSVNLLDEPLLANQDWVRAGGFVSQIAVPLLVGDRALGALVVATKTPREFSPDDEELLRLFAAKAATALQNARLYGELRQAYEDLSRTQAQLTQAQKMEAVGRLAGGIAHDFNNLLTVIRGRSRLSLSTVQTDNPLRRHMEIIDRTADRAARLTQQLLAFSRKQVLQPRVLDLNEVIAGTGELLRRLITEDIQFVAEREPMLGRLLADPVQIEQVIVNLAVNARDAMPHGGRLIFRTRNVTLSAEATRQYRGMWPGRYVMLQVIDTGHGMDATTRARIFEPFFTTKEKGTGLGLAIVFNIIRKHGSEIAVQSEEGRGTTFTVTLPVQLVRAGSEPAASPAEVIG